MSHLRIQLLGTFQVLQDDIPVTGFRTDKIRALLAYLAVESDRPHRRDALATLFWPEMDDQTARYNLRLSLHRLRQTLGDNAEALQADQQSIRLDSSQIWVDVLHLTQCITAVSTHPHTRPEDCPTCMTQLETAVTDYQGDFLPGFFLDDDLTFSEWVTAQRERCHQAVLQALQWLAEYHRHSGQMTQTIPYIQRQLELEPWRESAHRQMMRALVAAGQRPAALNQYETCRRVLWEELGVVPAPATETLYQHIKNNAARALPPLPTAPTPCLGREAELADLDRILANPDCHLLTITGTGGIGKTRLALACAARQAISFLDGVLYVTLQPADDLATAVAHAAQLTTTDQTATVHHLQDYLRQQELLLVLDNFEAILTPASLETVSQIMKAGHNLKLLVTCRTALNLLGEWRYPLGGLPLPKEADAAMVSGAVQLFVSSGQRIRPDGLPDMAHDPAVIRICQLLDGMPLALELAAAWLKLLSPSEIAEAIAQNLDILATTAINLPPRHRSLRAVFDSTWQRLSPDHQQTLARLSLFNGRFHHQAAINMLDGLDPSAALTHLAVLCDHALVRSRHIDKVTYYDLHETIRFYASENLSSEEREKAQAQHGRIYTTFLQQQAPHLRGAKRQVALEMIEREWANICAAWQWAFTHSAWEAVAVALPALHLFLEMRGRFQEGADWFAAAVSAFAGAEEHASMLGGCLEARQAWFCWRLGQVNTAHQLAERALASAQQQADASEIAFAQHLLGRIAFDQGEYVRAQSYLGESVATWRPLDAWGTALSLFHLGRAYLAVGAYDEAVRPYQEGMALFAQENYQVGMTTALGDMGQAIRNLGHQAEARQMYQESLAFCQEAGDVWGVAAILENLGAIDAGLGNLAAAETSYRLSLAVRRQLQDRRGMAATLIALSQLAFHQDDAQQAQVFCQRSLEIARKLGDRLGVARALLHLAHILGSLLQAAAAWACLQEAYQLGQAMGKVQIVLEVALESALLLVQRGDTMEATEIVVLLKQYSAVTPELMARIALWLPEVTAVSVATEIDLETAVASLLAKYPT